MINYLYTTDGSKQEKKVAEYNLTVTHSGNSDTTDIFTYTRNINGLVLKAKTYSNATLNGAFCYTNRLQFGAQPEGRVKAVYSPANDSVFSRFEYDLVKDHLGNVRMVLTEERKQDEYPAATMELAQAATEERFYSNIAETRWDRPSGYTDTNTDPNNKVSKVNGSDNKIGPAILLKVMAGDQFNINASAWWTTGSSAGTNTSPLLSIVSALIGGAPGMSVGKLNAGDLTSTILNPQVGDFLATQPGVTGKPKAYLNWVLFDEQFKFVESSSGAEAVGDVNEVKPFTKANMPLHKNGYLYIIACPGQ